MTLNSRRGSSSSSDIEIIPSKKQSQPPLPPQRLPSSPSSPSSSLLPSPIVKPTLSNNLSQLNARPASILIDSSDEEAETNPPSRTLSTSNLLASNTSTTNLNQFKPTHSTKDKGKSKAIELSDTEEEDNDAFNPQAEVDIHMGSNHDDDDQLPAPDLLFSQGANSLQPRPTSQSYKSFEYTSNPNLKEKEKEKKTTKTKTKTNTEKTKKTKESKEIEKLQKQAQLKEDREAKKAAKAQEKSKAKDLRDANKLMTRQEAISEIQLRVPSVLVTTKSAPITKSIDQINIRILNEEGTKMRNPVIDDSESELIRWMRTCTKEWNEDLNQFLPCDTREVWEDCVCLVWDAKEIDEWIYEGNGELLMRAKSIREDRPGDQIFIMVYGLESLMKTQKNVQNAQIKNQIRSDLRGEDFEEPSSSSSNKRKRTPNGPKNSMDEITRELEMIKILTKCFVLKVEDPAALANWLWEFSFEIAIKPYKAKKQKLKADLNLEMEGTKGKDLEDTYIKMLTCISRVGESEAKGIVEKYPTLNRLYSAWDLAMANQNKTGAENMLVGCKKGNSSKAIGQVTSKKIFHILYASTNGDTCANNN